MFQGDDQTITCTAQGDRVTVQNGYNHKAQYNERMMGVSYVSSLLTCPQISYKAQYNDGASLISRQRVPDTMDEEYNLTSSHETF